MANYVFLMQFHNESALPISDAVRLVMISEIGSGVSMVGCVLTLSLLCFLPIKGDGLFIIGNMSIVMMAAQLSFIGAENTSYPHPVMCKIAACLLHYFFLCVHFASLSYGIHLWSKFGPQSLATCGRKGIYLVMIWVAPLLVVLTTVFTRGQDYAMGDICWLPPFHQTRLAFLLPIGLTLSINLGLYFLIIITRVRLDLKRSQKMSTICRHVFWASMSLFPVLSLHWIVGFSVTIDRFLALQYTYVLMCSGQGILLLVFHVLTTGQIRKALCSKLSERGSDDSADSGSGPTTLFSNVEDVQKHRNKPRAGGQKTF